MTDFNSDLNSEKLAAIESAIQQLESEISDAKGDIDRLEVIEFFDRGEESRQAIVHWLDEVDGATIASMTDAQNAFIAFSETRAGEPTKHQVSHGDVLVIGGGCPWYALCAKVDVGVVGGDAGFQEEDPMNVAGTELENDRAYKEFIVWGGCGNEGGDPGGGVGCPPSVAVSVPTLCASSTASPGGPTTIQAITNIDPTNLDPEDFPLFKLKQLSLTASNIPEPIEGDTKFLAFNENAVKNCDTGCTGLFVDLKKFSTEKTNHKFESEVSLFTLTSTPVSATPTTLQLTTNTLTLTPGSASLDSNSCGQLSVSLGGGDIQGGACGATVSATTISQINPPGNPTNINNITVTENGNETVSLGSSKLVSDLVEIPLGPSASDDKTVFLPVVTNNDCPYDGDVEVVTKLDDPSISVGACEDGCQEIIISQQVFKTTLSFKCGLLVDEGDETIGDDPPVTTTFKVPCGCNIHCDPQPPVQSVTVNFSSHPNNAQLVGINENYVLTLNGCQYENFANGNNMVIQGNAATGNWTAFGNGGTGNWSIGGTGNSPNSIPQQTVVSGIAGNFIIVTYS